MTSLRRYPPRFRQRPQSQWLEGLIAVLGLALGAACLLGIAIMVISLINLKP